VHMRALTHHFRITHIGNGLNCTFPSCKNNNGRGYSQLDCLIGHFQSIHFISRQDMGEGFPNPHSLSYHVQRDHSDGRFDCLFLDCLNNKGRGFSRPQALATHVKDVHSGVRRYCCTDPDCDNNNGEGWSNELSLSRHVESAHMGCKFNCSFNGCGNNKKRGFARSALYRHIKNAHHS
jgi:hypothetical protein